jgi:hypothetical protein
MKLYTTNCHEFGPGTLIEAIHDMDQFETDDLGRAVEVLEVQTAAARVLEARGWVYNEETEDWEHEV